jgi:hypothetical protein
VALVLCLSAIVVGCSLPPTATPAPTSSDAPVSEAPAGSPAASLTPINPEPSTPDPATLEPATPEPAPAATPTLEPAPAATPTAEPVQPTPEPTADSTAAPPAVNDGCTGTDENRAFYAAVAAAVDWSVYCPSLPRGWFVQSGQYRLADGGRLEITYHGPDGSGLMLQEGAFCMAGDCAPPGEDRGETAFGDRSGTLVRTADGFAVIVDGGQRPSWLLLVNGQTEEETRRIAADLVRVGS